MQDTEHDDFSFEGSQQAYDAIHKAIDPLMRGDDLSAKQIIFGLAMNVGNCLLHVSDVPNAYFEFQQALSMVLADEVIGEDATPN